MLYSFDDRGAQRADIRRGLVSRAPLVSLSSVRLAPELYPVEYRPCRPGALALACYVSGVATSVSRSEELRGPIRIIDVALLQVFGAAATAGVGISLYGSASPGRDLAGPGDVHLLAVDAVVDSVLFSGLFPWEMPLLGAGNGIGPVQVDKVLGSHIRFIKLAIRSTVAAVVEIVAFISYEYVPYAHDG